MRRLENMAAQGGSISIKSVDNSDHKRTASDIKAEMEELQKIICDENASAKDRESASIFLPQSGEHLRSEIDLQIRKNRPSVRLLSPV